jgi:hypothetical protein
MNKQRLVEYLQAIAAMAAQAQKAAENGDLEAVRSLLENIESDVSMLRVTLEEEKFKL